MLSHYETWCFLFLGVNLLASRWNPWASYVCGAFIVVLSLIKLVG